MIPCISQVTTLSTPFEEDLGAFARAGWPAVELWLTKLEEYLRKHSIDEAKGLFRDEGIRPLAAASQGGLLAGRPEARAIHHDHFRRRLDLLAELGVPTLIASCDFPEEPDGSGLSVALESLVTAGAEAGSRGIRIALELQKTSRFGSSLDTVLALIAQAGSPHIGACLDVFHFFTGPSKTSDLEFLSPENLFWVQVSDLAGVPRELARDTDRILPGDGDLPVAGILERLRGMGYEGGVSLELLSSAIRDVPAAIAADAGLRAMARLFDQLGAGDRQTIPGGD